LRLTGSQPLRPALPHKLPAYRLPGGTSIVILPQSTQVVLRGGDVSVHILGKRLVSPSLCHYPDWSQASTPIRQTLACYPESALEHHGGQRRPQRAMQARINVNASTGSHLLGQHKDVPNAALVYSGSIPDGEATFQWQLWHVLRAAGTRASLD
jgi:hypothetical protein